MTDTDWKPKNPCGECSIAEASPTRINKPEDCEHNYLYGCVRDTAFKAEIEGQKRLLHEQIQIAQHSGGLISVGEIEKLFRTMLKELEELK